MAGTANSKGFVTIMTWAHWEAVNRAALRRQLTLLKDMGCDAIRTAHNMPAPELVELCDEMGFMVVVEAFDEWNVAKCRNGYHRFFDEWAERDMVNMIRHFRNHPSVVMWSIGNEVSAQCDGNGRGGRFVFAGEFATAKIRRAPLLVEWIRYRPLLKMVLRRLLIFRDSITRFIFTKRLTENCLKILCLDLRPPLRSAPGSL